MIPVLGVPYINRPDRFVEMVESIDVEVGRLIIVDNSDDGSCPVPAGGTDIVHIAPHHNLGVAASWNLIIKASPLAPWWAIVNADLVFGPGHLEQLETAMDEHQMVLMEGMACFGIHHSVVEAVGWFDEAYVPAYCEDNDYQYRCGLAGIDKVEFKAGIKHYGSSTIYSDERLMAENSRTYQGNVAYHKEKWGDVMGLERFRSPFNRGGPITDTYVPLERLRLLTWRTG